MPRDPTNCSVGGQVMEKDISMNLKEPCQKNKKKCFNRENAIR